MFSTVFLKENLKFSAPHLPFLSNLKLVVMYNAAGLQNRILVLQV